MFATGAPSPGMFVILSGHTAITQYDGLGHVAFAGAGQCG